MKVTDEMIEKAYDIIWLRGNSHDVIRETLEAVFDMVEPEEKIHSDQIPEFDIFSKPKKNKTIGEMADFISDLAYKKLMKKLEPKRHLPEEKRLYKLSDMWKGWGFLEGGGYFQTAAFANKEIIVEEYYNNKIVAITPADATEFYEGEGLDD